MISSVMRRLMAVQAEEQADLISPVWIWEIFLEIYLEISLAAVEDRQIMDLEKVQIFVPV